MGDGSGLGALPSLVAPDTDMLSQGPPGCWRRLCCVCEVGGPGLLALLHPGSAFLGQMVRVLQQFSEEAGCATQVLRNALQGLRLPQGGECAGKWLGEGQEAKQARKRTKPLALIFPELRACGLMPAPMPIPRKIGAFLKSSHAGFALLRHLEYFEEADKGSHSWNWSYR